MAVMNPGGRQVRGQSSFDAEQGAAFSRVARYLRQPDSTPPLAEMAASCGLQARLVSAIGGIERGASTLADAGALFGAVLRREQARTGHAQTLVVDRSYVGPRPDLDMLRRGCLSVSTVSDGYVLAPVEWCPEWLNHTTGSPLDEIDACLERRVDTRVPADPFFTEAFNFRHYSSAGQRDAVRAVSLAGDDETVLVSLPTGAGKTVVGLVRAFSPSTVGTTVVIVPTVSLARDHEHEIANLASTGRFAHDRFAYVGPADEARATKDQIVARIEEGTQGVVVAAPEQLRGRLGSAIANAAGNGRISAFVIDEAHTVNDWGNAFRGDFQLVGPYVRGIRMFASAQFPVILLSATLTEDTLLTLRATFERSDDRRWTVVEANLRGEPSYWVSRCSSEDERSERLLDAVRVAPRPAIVYVNRPVEADAIYGQLSRVGFRRIATYHGGTSSSQRSAVEQGWRSTTAEPRYDVVIATSAFGLGINQQDVRAVIHARQPESVSRYYQEVGRGGRDGRAMFALLLVSSLDAGTTQALSRERILNDRLEAYWKSLERDRVQRRSKVLGTAGLQWVDLATVPADRLGQGYIGTDRYEEWNVNTLTLFQRAGLIDVISPVGSRPPMDIRKPIAYGLAEDVHGNTENLLARASAERSRTQGAARSALLDMDELARGTSRFEETFMHAFSLSPEVTGAAAKAIPAPTCGGCPGCRTARHLPIALDSNVCVGPSSDRALTGFAQLVMRYGPNPRIFIYQRNRFADVERVVASAYSRGMKLLITFGGGRDLKLAHLGVNELIVDRNPAQRDHTSGYRFKRPSLCVAYPEDARLPQWIVDDADPFRGIVVAPTGVDHPGLGEGRSIEGHDSTYPISSLIDALAL